MALAISWTADFETGIDIIDDQHKRIFDYLKEIDQAIAIKSIRQIEYVIKSLIDYAISHNTFEESLMEKAGYPMLEAHHQVHERFKERAHSYLDRFSGGEDPIKLAREVRGDMGLWLTNHIKRDDKHYVNYVKRNIEGSFVTRMLGMFFR
ncbi:bacteriohemerythrin [Pseudomonas sp. MAP12]|uniref:Bacteriohemerythrin n=1 Tax=Geopseudomonas aromaticivorans TaxID=2849492 RepID=A0ABS6MVV9_9GAMM|nr:bacteriohemerythrin [Pseudomonas aromaticivorans]MBV2132937.1 bacteriohemerythrin [Pseudomonas aromaticivorans]